jgi:hypothetical protein
LDSRLSRDCIRVARRLSWAAPLHGDKPRPLDLPLSAGKLRLSTIGITEEQVRELSSATLVDRLVATGSSRLSAERIVAIERGLADAGRARSHAKGRH